MTKLPQNLVRLMNSIQPDLDKRAEAVESIRRRLKEHADGKKLKGDEITAWLGEIYGKLFLKGTLVSEEYDHDFTAGDMRVSVKARKGRSGITSIISRIEGEGCPTHLMFIQFSDGYSPERIYLFPWGYLLEHRRFKEKTVRGGRRGYYMSVGPSRDSEFLSYSRAAGDNEVS